MLVNNGKKMKNCALKLVIVNGIINFRELNSQSKVIKFTRNSSEVVSIYSSTRSKLLKVQVFQSSRERWEPPERHHNLVECCLTHKLSHITRILSQFEGL